MEAERVGTHEGGFQLISHANRGSLTFDRSLRM
ncbi:hypothetical protein RKD23_001956 [Streptomyces sp. SAI-170]